MALLDHDRRSRPVGVPLPPAPLIAAPLVRPAFPQHGAGTAHVPDDDHGRLVENGPADELDCLRGVLSPGLLQAAAARSRAIGLGADQILINQGVIDESAYLQNLSADLGIALDPLPDVARQDLLMDDSQISTAARSGMLHVRSHGEMLLVIAPRCHGARALTRAVRSAPALASKMRLIATQDLNRLLTRHGGPALAHKAARELHESAPDFSAAPAGDARTRQIARASAIGSFAALVVLPPFFAGLAWSSVLTLAFFAFVVFRLAACLTPRLPAARRRPRRPDAGLPIYSVIVALYHEARSIGSLLRSIEAIDYPREKLDIILVTEPDDLETRAAIARLGPMPHVQLLIAPAIAPKTKPKALNYALSFARGSFIAVFDAEDLPEPGQLRAALDVLLGDDRVGCAQASLCIDNAAAGWLPRMFAAEYAGQFDLFLPGLANSGLPLPLGGSSNHFHTDTLRRLGGWDAYNVTEDADLGIRLARFGYHSVMFRSTTYEEAPVHPAAWLRQRSRWMKGWMQTWCVHMRRPRRLWRDVGPRSFVAINLTAGATILTAMAYPTLLAGLLTRLVAPQSDSPGDPSATLHLVVIAVGLLSTVGIGLRGLAARRHLRHGWVLLLTPVYWGLLSIAAWRALWQLLRDPYHWEKTEHGLSPRDRPAAPVTDSA